MKTVIIRRFKDKTVKEEVMSGKEVNWSCDTNVFRVWDASRTLVIPYQMIESVEIKIDPHELRNV